MQNFEIPWRILNFNKSFQLCPQENNLSPLKKINKEINFKKKNNNIKLIYIGMTGIK